MGDQEMHHEIPPRSSTGCVGLGHALGMQVQDSEIIVPGIRERVSVQEIEREALVTHRAFLVRVQPTPWVRQGRHNPVLVLFVSRDTVPHLRDPVQDPRLEHGVVHLRDNGLVTPNGGDMKINVLFHLFVTFFLFF
jgi:hypothetical protein